MAVTEKPVVNSLWIGDKLSSLEVLTIKSFQANGYKFKLWVYGDVANIPENTIVENAGKIIPQNDVFNYTSSNKYGHGKGSFAGFSDIFRYKLLYEEGGIWSDMDITCIKPLRHDTDYIFRYHKQLGMVGNFMQCPKGSELMKWCYERAAAEVKSDNQDWLLPIKILNEGVVKYNLSNFIGDFSNSDEFPLVSRLIRSSYRIDDSWYIIHWLNEEFRRLGINKDRVVKNSSLDQLYIRFGVKVEPFEGVQLYKTKFKLSRVNYLWVNLISRLKWFSGMNF